MRIARLELTGPQPASQATAELVLDILWAHLEPGHNVEHITATATPRGIDLVVFLRHRVANPEQYAGALVGGMVNRLPALRSWACG